MKSLVFSFLMLSSAFIFTSEAQAQSCSARMVSAQGRTIETFLARGQGRRACAMALRRCENELERRQRSGLNPYARCVVDRYGYGGPDYPDYPGNPDYPGYPDDEYDRARVTRTCTYDLVENAWLFRVVRNSYTRYATGPRGTGVRQRACQLAQRDCERDRRGNQLCLLSQQNRYRGDGYRR